jgi:hypothetical protein
MLSPEKALSSARQHLFERCSVLAGHEILAEALNQGSCERIDVFDGGPSVSTDSV